MPKLKEIEGFPEKRTMEDCGKERFCDYCKGYNHARSEDGEVGIEIDAERVKQIIRDCAETNNNLTQAMVKACPIKVKNE